MVNLLVYLESRLMLKKNKKTSTKRKRKYTVHPNQKTQDTKPELIFEAICKELGLLYNKQQPLCGFFYDFYIPIKHTHKHCNKGIMVEIHGDYFHVNPYTYKGKMSSLNYMQRSNMKNDKVKSQVAIRNGFQYVCVWETDLMTSVQEVKKQLQDIITYENSIHGEKHAIVLLEDKKELYHKYVEHLDDFFENHE